MIDFHIIISVTITIWCAKQTLGVELNGEKLDALTSGYIISDATTLPPENADIQRSKFSITAKLPPPIEAMKTRNSLLDSGVKDIDQDIIAMKELIKSLEGSLQHFNSMYIGRLDQKLTSIATNVASMDSNVKNIQGRAHVWDTFQLHVSAWNEQIKSLDRKVDIINSGQEKMVLLEGKLSFLLNLEYMSGRTLNKVSSIEDRLEQLERGARRWWEGGEVRQESAARGVLPALRALDRRAERTLTLLHQMTRTRRFGRRQITNETAPSRKLLIKCSTPPIVEELVKDMASKVDLIYDRVAAANCTGDDDGRKVDAVEEVEEIDHDYSVEMYQSDDTSGNENPKKTFKTRDGPKRFKRNRETRARSERNCKVTLRALQKLANKVVKNTNDDIKIELRELNNKLTSVFKHTNVGDLSDNIDLETDNKNVDKDMEAARGSLQSICKVLTTQRTDGDQKSVFKRMGTELRNQNLSKTFDCVLSKAKSCLLYTADKDLAETDSNESETNERFDASDKSISEKTEVNKEHKEVGGVDLEGLDKVCGEENYDTYIDTVRKLACRIITEYKKTKQNIINFCRLPGSNAFCDLNGYLVFQRRTNNEEDFSRNWTDYKWGFGNLATGNYWLGTVALHLLTAGADPSVLRVELQDFEGNVAWAEYDRFKVASEEDQFRLWVSGYRGNATDSLSYHSGSRFSTWDRRNDESPACCPCSNSLGRGGWWFKNCLESNLNGRYFGVSSRPETGSISWELWRPEGSMARTLMSVSLPDSGDVGNETRAEDP